MAATSPRMPLGQFMEDLMCSHRWARAVLFALAAVSPSSSAWSRPASPRRSRSRARPRRPRRPSSRARSSTAGGNWRYWFGNGYRKAWTTPVELPVLDLATEKGGLQPLAQVGGFQTEGLAMKGGDGRGYTFRKLEKHPERVLPKEWQDSELRAIAIDQTAAAHPAATAIVGSLARSVGIPFYRSRLAVMPDDPALGKFRETFGGTVGTLDEYITPGYEGITEIVSSFDLWKKWLEGGPGEPRRQPRVPEGAPLRPRGRELGPPPGPVAVGPHARQAAVGAVARGRRPGVHALRGQGDGCRAQRGAALHALLRRVPEADGGADHEQLRRDPLAALRRGVAGRTRRSPASSRPG